MGFLAGSKGQDITVGHNFKKAWCIDVISWTVNSVRANEKSDVNSEIGINFVWNFGPPLRYINIILSTVCASKDGLSTDLPNSCLPW